MANTFTSLNYDLVFSTKNREPWLEPKVRERLWPYLGGIARENGMKALDIGGAADHVHILLSVPASMSLAKGVQLIKGGSSRWMKEAFPKLANAAWPDGYAAFAVSQSQLESVPIYPRSGTASPEQEFRPRHQIEYDERFLLG